MAEIIWTMINQPKSKKNWSLTYILPHRGVVSEIASINNTTTKFHLEISYNLSLSKTALTDRYMLQSVSNNVVSHTTMHIKQKSRYNWFCQMAISLPTYELWWSVYFQLDLATPQVPNSGHQIDLYNYQKYAIEMEIAPSLNKISFRRGWCDAARSCWRQL